MEAGSAQPGRTLPLSTAQQNSKPQHTMSEAPRAPRLSSVPSSSALQAAHEAAGAGRKLLVNIAAASEQLAHLLGAVLLLWPWFTSTGIPGASGDAAPEEASRLYTAPDAECEALQLLASELEVPHCVSLVKVRVVRAADLDLNPKPYEESETAGVFR